jgi:transcriptional regulator with XRE-family HTH domain
MEDRFRKSALTGWPENSTLTAGATIPSYAGNMDVKPMGERIRALRIESGFSIRRLGELAGISHSFLRDIECGHRNPTEPVLARIAGALGVKATDLREINPKVLLSSLKHLLEKQPAWCPAMKRLIERASDGTLTPSNLLKKIGREK